MSVFFQDAIIYLALSPVYLLIAASVLAYRAALLKPSPDTLQKYFDELGFPLNRVFDAFYSSSGHSAIETLTKASQFDSLLGIVIYSLVRFMFTVIQIKILLAGGDPLNAIFWIIVEILSLFFVYRFGSKLKELARG